MKRFIRIVGLTFGLLLLFLAALIFTNGWLKKQNEELLHDTIRSRTAQFSLILELTQAGPPPWSEEFTRRLGLALGARIIIRETPVPLALGPVSASDARWRFEHVFRDAAGAPAAYAHVLLPPPPTVRAMAMLQRVSALLLSFALLLLVVLVLLVFIDRRWFRTDDRDGAAHSSAHGEGFTVLSHLAERSARQSRELEEERGERRRAEADKNLQQILLNRALQEKIDMGRDLHDGLIQSLYAAGLTIQAARRSIIQDPPQARAQLETATQTLNGAIREVRQYISGLTAEQLRERSFAESVRALTNELTAGRAVVYDLRIDEEAARRIPPAHTTDLLQIVREAVSNSLRHGHAGHISVRLHRESNTLALLVHDDGTGFESARAERGHGLDNMQARATRLGATLRCTSEVGAGTRIVLQFSASPVSEHP